MKFYVFSACFSWFFHQFIQNQLIIHEMTDKKESAIFVRRCAAHVRAVSHVWGWKGEKRQTNGLQKDRPTGECTSNRFHFLFHHFLDRLDDVFSSNSPAALELIKSSSIWMEQKKIVAARGQFWPEIEMPRKYTVHRIAAQFDSLLPRKGDRFSFSFLIKKTKLFQNAHRGREWESLTITWCVFWRNGCQFEINFRRAAAA